MFEQFQNIYELAKQFLDTRNNEIHTKISRDFAVRLMQAEGGDPMVIFPAIILHDVGWKMIPEDMHLRAFGPNAKDMETNRIHEVEGARIAREVLQKVNYEDALIDEIAEIIAGHDSREKPMSLNDAIVKDADKLWRFSKEAFSIDPERFGVAPALHILWLEKQIDGWLITETGRKIAREEQRKRARTLNDATR